MDLGDGEEEEEEGGSFRLGLDDEWVLEADVPPDVVLERIEADIFAGRLAAAGRRDPSLRLSAREVLEFFDFTNCVVQI